MRYLRMLTNAALGGALGAAFVTVLVLQLNPRLPLSPLVAVPLYARIALFYGIHLAVGFYALIVLRQMFAREALSPGWVSVRLLAWMGAALAAAGVGLMWFNLTTLRSVLDAEGARRMAAGTAATAVCSILLFVIAIVHDSFGRRGSRVGASVLAVTVAAAIGLPLLSRGPGGALPPLFTEIPAVQPISTLAGHVKVLLLDGASLEYILPATAEGRLPNFGRLLDAGAVMHLETLRPTQPEPVWAAALTGRQPSANGMRSAATYGFGLDEPRLELLPDLCFAHALVHFGILDEQPNRAGALRAAPVWEILSRAGLDIGVAGVPLTTPVVPVNGYIVSDRAHLSNAAAVGASDADIVFPAGAFAFVAPIEARATWPVGEGGAPTAVPTARDAIYDAVWQDLDAKFAPRVSFVRFEGIDLAGHHYLRYAVPSAFGDVSGDERRRFGQVLDQHYAWVDDRLGAVLAGLGPDDVVVIVSGFGMEPVSLGKRMLARLLGETRLSGSHEGAPDGFMLALGGPIARGRFPVGSVLDVTPTLLYLAGLPLARDLDGGARTDIFAPAFTAEHPVAFIPTYGR